MMYLEEFEKRDMSPEETAGIIYDNIKSNDTSFDYLIKEIKDFEKVKKIIFTKIINYNANKEYLKDVPHRKVFGDLAVICYLLIREDGRNMDTSVIRGPLLENWDIDDKELFKIAKKNTKEKYPYAFKSFFDYLPPQLQIFENEIDKDRYPFYILNHGLEVSFGARTILYPGVLKKVSKDLGDVNLMLIPSSLHEWIIIPDKDDELNMEHVMYTADLIKEVNGSVLNEDEVLSDHPYFYNKDTGKVTSAEKFF